MDGVELLTIGEIAARSRLSPKALRLYDRLGLLAPARVDSATGYRWYRPDQVERARLVALLRQLDMPLARIAEVIALPGEQAAAEVAAYWTGIEERHAVRSAVAAHIRDRLSGRRTHMYEVRTVDAPEQAVLTERRHLLTDELPRWIPAALGRLTGVAGECGGVAGAPFVVYHSDMSLDTDGSAEACVPVADRAAAQAYVTAATGGGRTADLRVEPARHLAYVRITKAQVAHPQILSAFQAAEEWISARGLTISGPCREIYFADWDAASASDEVCDIAFPVE
ncbi:MerR family transcriptional regulator [Streptomyces sp. NPDC059092]|uniref:MerR family transcriptional regulator n=1 Tax=Streptomyces sp. NPDC059092 TaxID=3346725 RepID=UPI0036CB90C9